MAKLRWQQYGRWTPDSETGPVWQADGRHARYLIDGYRVPKPAKGRNTRFRVSMLPQPVSYRDRPTVISDQHPDVLWAAKIAAQEHDDSYGCEPRLSDGAPEEALSGLEPALSGSITPATRVKLTADGVEYVDRVLRLLCRDIAPRPYLCGCELVIPHDAPVAAFVNLIVSGCIQYPDDFRRRSSAGFVASVARLGTDIISALAADGRRLSEQSAREALSVVAETDEQLLARHRRAKAVLDRRLARKRLPNRDWEIDNLRFLLLLIEDGIRERGLTVPS